MGKGNADTGRIGYHVGGVSLQPILRARVKLAQLLGGNVSADRGGQPGGGFGHVDTIVEVTAERQREFIEQQVLRGEFPTVWQPVKGRVVTMHVPVQAFHDVRESLDVGHFGLHPVPLRKCIHGAQVVRIGNAAFASGLKRVFQCFHAGQVIDNEVRIAPKLVTLVKILRPVIGQLIARDACYQDHCHQGREAEQKGAAGNDKRAKAVEKAGTVGTGPACA